jgi:hypothetical protein
MANTDLRLTDALLGSKAMGRWALDRPMLDPRYGGQGQYTTDYPSYINHEAYVQGNLIIKVLAVPRGLSYLPDADVWIGMAKAFFERQIISFEGLRAKLTGDFATYAFGSAGEEQEIIRDVKRERSQLTTEFIERKGLPWTDFFEFMLQLFGMHEETKWPMITAITNQMTDNLSDNCAWVILAFEPDPMLRTVLKAWIGVDIKPKEGVEVTGKYNKNSPGDIITASIPWTGIWQYGYGPRVYATQVLRAMNFVGANPNMRSPVVSRVSADVSDVGNGYAEQVSQVAAEAGT